MFPLRGLTSDYWDQLSWWRKILDYFWHLVLPITSMGLGAFATTTLLTKNSFLDEIRKQYVLTARAKGCTEHQVLYGHVFRNAMLLVIAELSGRICRRVLWRLAADRNDLLARRTRAAQLRKRSQSRLSRRVCKPLYLRADRSGGEPDLRSHLYVDRSAHRFRIARGLSDGRERCRKGVGNCGRLSGGCGRAADKRRFGLSPVNKRRWQNFKSNRRGYWSLWIFLFLFVVTLFAEFIANDHPFFVRFDGKFYFPAVITYPETAFGGDFETAADYRDPYLQKLIADKGGTIIWPPIRYSYSTHNLDLPTPAPSKPTWMLTEAQCKTVVEKKGLNGCSDLEYNWLGTDDQGRDVAARLIYGFRISVLFGLDPDDRVVGHRHRGRRGARLFRRLDRPSVPALHRNLEFGAGALSAAHYFIDSGAGLLRSARHPAAVLMGALVGLVRAEFLRARNLEYVRAARALGVSNVVIMFRHVLPNAMVASLTFLPFILSSSVMTLTALDFLGFGLPPGSPSLGEMLSQAKANIQAPWLGMAGFFTVAIMLSLLIFIGEAVRDAFDPRKTFG